MARVTAGRLAPCSQVDLVHAGGDDWHATGGDPQFHFALAGPLDAGYYRLTAWLDGDAVQAPRIYLDHGDNWSEATALLLDAWPGSAAWTCTRWLPAFSGLVRLDPGEREGTLRFGGLEITRLDDDAAVLSALSNAADADPLGLGRRLSLARAAMDGGAREIAWAALASSGASGTGAPLDASPRRPVEAARAVDVDHVAALQRLERRPLVTLIVPAGEDPRALAATCGALARQAWPDWELLVAIPPDAAGACEGLPRSSRIRTVPAGADAAGLARLCEDAGGAWIGLLSPGTVLAEDALLSLVAATDGRDGLRVAYGDLARVEAPGAVPAVEYRPGWNPALAAACDYVREAAWFAATAVGAAPPPADVAGWDALHHDLLLRVAGGAGADDVLHLPRVLAEAIGAAPVADPVVAAAHFARIGCPVRDPAEAALGPGLPDPLPSVALVIPTRDRLDLLRRCVDSVLGRSTWPRLEIVIVDNQSREPETLAWFDAITADPRVRVLPFDEPFNYSRINNVAVAQVDADIIGLLNNDIEVITPDWIEAMVRHAARPDVGAVGAMLYYPDDTIQHAGVIVGLGGVAGHAYPHRPRGSRGHCGRLQLPQDLSAVTAACLLVRRAAYREVGGFDEGLAVAFNDVDFCLRLREAGYRNVWTPHAELYHHESASRGSEDTDEKRARFSSEVHAMLGRWRDALQHDPAYHPSLSLVTGEDFLPARGIARGGRDDTARAWLRGGAPPGQSRRI